MEVPGEDPRGLTGKNQEGDPVGENTAWVPPTGLPEWNESGGVDRPPCGLPHLYWFDEWGCGLVSLDLDGKEQRCAQADASGLACETGWGVPSLGSYRRVGEDYVGPGSPG